MGLGCQKRGLGVVVATAIACTVAAPAQAAEQTRHSIVGGCYALEAPGGGFVSKAGGVYSADAAGVGAAERFRLQATDLATYLLYDRDRQFLAARAGESAAAAEPSPEAEWKVAEAGGGGFTMRNLATGDALAFGDAGALDLVRARGCVDYPEITHSTRGRPSGGDSPFSETRGFWDPHMHLMAFEAFGGGFHCGRPWHRYGVPYALPDCSRLEGPGGGAPVENYLNWGTPVHDHDTAGWPTFKDWPNYHSFTYEQTYYKWIERAWRGGLRLGVNLFVDNRSWCETLAQRQNQLYPCDEMETVRREARSIYEMQDYIDAQSGGPGKGFFRIVTNPFEARRVINQGKLAIVLGIEVSELFGCILRDGESLCDRAHVDRSLDEVYEMGVRDLELLNKYDNAFVGVRFDDGFFGTFVNLGNRYTTGRFWQAQTCTGGESDNTIETAQMDVLVNLGVTDLIPPGGLPVYPRAPHCNALGITPLGEYLVGEMMERGMIIDPDHMSVEAANRTLELAREAGYSGLVSSHDWTDPHNWPDIYELGGVIAPQGDDSDDFVETWRTLRKMRDRDYLFGIGFGDDMGGFSSTGEPRVGAENPVRYPFESFDGVTMKRQQSGTQVYDINEDGVAHFGLYPDWVEDLRMLAGGKIVRDLARGSEAYLQMWERAVGVPPERCRPSTGKLTRSGLGRLRLGDSAKRALKRAGQPERRVDRTYRYCVAGKPNKRAKIEAAFTAKGKLRSISVDARGYEAGGVAVGDSAAAVRRASRAGQGARFVYRVRGGVVRSVGVTTKRG